MVKLSFYEQQDDILILNEKILRLKKRGDRYLQTIRKLKKKIRNIQQGINHETDRPIISRNYTFHYNLKEITQSIRDKTVLSNDIGDELSLNLTAEVKSEELSDSSLSIAEDTPAKNTPAKNTPTPAKNTLAKSNVERLFEKEAEEANSETDSDVVRSENSSLVSDEELRVARRKVEQLYMVKQKTIDKAFQKCKLKSK